MLASESVAERLVRFRCAFSQFYPLLGDGNRMVPKIRSEVGLDPPDALVGLHIDLVEKPLEPPPDALSGHPEYAFNAVAIILAEDQMLETIVFQFDAQLLLFEKLSQVVEERLILRRKFHRASPVFHARVVRARPRGPVP